MKRFLILILTVLFVLSGCTATSNQEKDNEKKDVVIVGGGISGMMAAIQFHQANPDLNVVLIEKQASLGGNLPYTGGVIMGFDENYTGSQSHQIVDTEEFVNCFHNVIQALEDYSILEEDEFIINDALVRNVFENHQEVVDYYFDIKVPFPEEFLPYMDHTYSNFYSMEGGVNEVAFEFKDALTQGVEETTVEVYLNTEVIELVNDGNKVTGVKVKSADEEKVIEADAVLLATGGIADNQELMEKYNQNYGDLEIYSTGASCGAAIELTRKFDTPVVSEGVFGAFVSSDSTWTLLQSYFMVDQDGTRFIDESASSYIQLIASHVLKSGNAWLLCDQNYADSHPDEIALKLSEEDLHCYDTLEELAEAEGIDYDNLVNTIKQYNDAVDAKQDDVFNLPIELANKIEVGPFYAEKCSEYCFETVPGILVNERLQVLDGNHEIVEGLYASGEAIIGNVLNNLYAQAGTGLSWGGTSGYTAAKMMVEDLKK